MDRRNLLSVKLCQILYYLTEACIVHVHVCDKEHAGQFILFAQLPCFLCSDFHAVLSGYDDDRSVRCRCRFLCLSNKIKVARCIQHINLNIAPFDRYCCRADRKLSLYLFFIKIADRISFCYISQSAGNSSKISHSLCQTGFS